MTEAEKSTKISISLAGYADTVKLCRKIVQMTGEINATLAVVGAQLRDSESGSCVTWAETCHTDFLGALHTLRESLGAPVETPKPETPGRYFVREAEAVRFDVVEIFEAFEELHVSYFMQDRATTLDDPRFRGATWWTCPEPRKDGEK